MMITFRDRYFYTNLTKPVYPVVDIGGIPHYNIGSIEADSVSDAIAEGYVIDTIYVLDKTPTIEFVVSSIGGIPKALVYIPTSTVEGMDGYGQLAFRYKETSGGEWKELIASVRSFPLENFLVSCAEQPDGIDVWAIDIDSMCESEALNGNAIDISITDILFTNEGERPRRLNYGSPLPRILWNNIDTAMAENLLDRVIESIARYEKRVAIDRTKATMTIDRKRHSVVLTIPYYVRENQKKYLYRKKFSAQ